VGQVTAFDVRGEKALFARVAPRYEDGGNRVCFAERRHDGAERADAYAAACEKGVDFRILPGARERCHLGKGALRRNARLVNARCRDAAADQVVGGASRTDGEALNAALRPDAMGVIVGDDAEKWRL
jgi:hypothetical protein